MAETLKVGMIGLDTSHVPAFTAILNDPDNPHHVPGAKVVAGFPGGSDDFPPSYERVDKYTAELRDNYQVDILDSPEAVAERVDLLFIMSVDGRVHPEQFERTVGYKRPTFVDKPFTVDFAEAEKMYRLADEHGIPLMSSSALRYAQPLMEALADTSQGPVRGIDVYGPMAIMPALPGWFWYGVHTAEVAVAALGAGCVAVHTRTSDDHDVAVAEWADGRMATLRGSRGGSHRFGATLHYESGPRVLDLSGGDRPYYAGLVEAIIGSLPDGRSAIPAEETLDVVQILESLNTGRETGETVTLKPARSAG